MARQGPSRGNNQLYGVSDDYGVVGHVAILWTFQHRSLDKLAVAVAISRIGVLPCTADLDCTLHKIAMPHQSFKLPLTHMACHDMAGLRAKLRAVNRPTSVSCMPLTC